MKTNLSLTVLCWTLFGYQNCSQQNNELLVTDEHTTVKERQRVNICKPFYTFC